MAREKLLLALEAGRWRVACVRGGQVEVRDVAAAPGQGPLDAVEALAEALDALDCNGAAVCLGLPSDWVLAGRIECDGLPRKDRRSAYLYRLEEQFPLPAEKLTAEFMGVVAGKALGLAVETARVRAVLDRLAEGSLTHAEIDDQSSG